MTESHLIDMKTQNKDKFFEAVIREYSGIVYSVVYRHLNYSAAKEDIEETVSDVFWSFYRSMDGYDASAGSLKVYLITIARNIAVSRHRALNGKHDFAFISLESEQTPDIPSACGGAEEEFLKKEEKEILFTELLKLKKPNGTIVFRKYYLRETSAQIAEATGLSINAVEKRLARSLKKLEKALEGILNG
ncbi:MAG: sigma-70 family RNA polymerase sigma factor [Eubacteriales bacterium]|nr:sigma-70 family RNA polymerase sigma factor [Eubacteriales bacterium]